MLRITTISLYIVSVMLLGCNYRTSSDGGGAGNYSKEHGFVQKYPSPPRVDGTYYENVPFVHAWQREDKELYGFVLPFPDVVIQFVEKAQGYDASMDVLYKQMIATGHGYRSDAATLEFEIVRFELEKFIDAFLADLEERFIPAADPVRQNWEEDGKVFFNVAFDKFDFEIEYQKISATRFQVVIDCLRSIE